MKRILSLLLVLLLLAGCSESAGKKPEPVQPILFFYRSAATGYADENGLIRGEQRDLGTKNYTETELFSLYFKGPERADLVSPAANGTVLLGVDRGAGSLTVRLREENVSRSGIDCSILDACLAKTGMQIEGIRKVRIRVEDRDGQVLRDNTLSEGDILLYDNGETPDETELTLYFSDVAHRYLLTEKRTVPYMDLNQLPAYVISQLLAGPQSAGMVSVLPQGAALLDLNVEGGICAVDFNADFYANRPETGQEEQLVLLSIVNSLCEIDGISQVQFYIEGRKRESYVSLSLTDPFVMDSSVVGPIREELNEFAGVLCLPGVQDGLLHRLQVRVRLRGNHSKEEALLLTLFDRVSQNGLRNPAENLKPPVSVEVSGFDCQVTLAPGSLSELDEQAKEDLLRCITATLTESTQVRRISFLADGQALTQKPLEPEDNWFCE